MISLLTALLAPALACPTIATGSPSELSFDTAQVAIVRQGSRTTFSVSINPLGDPQGFALLLPVPEVLTQEDVSVLDPEIFGRLNGYSAPRHVDDAGCPYWEAYDGGYYGSYGGGGGCDDTGGMASADGGGDGGDGGGGGNDYATVDVEAEYLVGIYEIVVLSADESSDLHGWLEANAYFLPEGAEPRLAEYIEQGSYFLAAKVAEEFAATDGVSLAPLQVSYDSDLMSIPMRLATLNSPGEQDMVIYALTARDADEANPESGRVGIANYPEFSVEKQCRWGTPDKEFTPFYEDQFTSAWAAVQDAGWTIEYSAPWNEFTPVTGISPSAKDLSDLGFEGPPEAHHLTRIHMRYTPDQAQEDLVLYASGISDLQAQTYADDNWMNQYCILSACESADVTVEDVAAPKSHYDDCADGEGDVDNVIERMLGCSAAGGLGGWGLAFAGVLGWRRRTR